MLPACNRAMVGATSAARSAARGAIANWRRSSAGRRADGDLVHQKRNRGRLAAGAIGKLDRAKTENRTIYSRTYG